jgi:hypothetical protein
MMAFKLTTVLFSGIQTARRWLEYRDFYQFFDLLEKEAREAPPNPTISACGMVIIRYDEDEIRSIKVRRAREAQDEVDHFRGLKEKYALAMRRP